MLLETFPTLETTAPRQAPADCRVFERKSCELPTTCHPASLMAMKEPGWTATIRDISLGGVRIDVSRRFEKGTPLAIELPGNSEHGPSVVFATVVHLKRLEDGISWVLGCKFLCELSEDDLEKLLHRAKSQRKDTVEPPVSDVATMPASVPAETTAPAVANEVLPPDITESTTLSNVHFHIAIRRGWQLNCHFKNFKASQCWPFVPGKIVHLNVGGGSQPGTPLRIQLVECRQEADAWHFQAKVLRTPNLPDLLRALASCC